MLWLVVSFFLLLILYILTIDSLRYWEQKNVPSEKALPLFGNLLYVALGKEDFWSMMERLYKKFDEKYFGIYLSHKPILVIKDRDMIKTVLMKNFTSFINRTNHENQKVDSLMSNTLFVLKNDVWRTTRRKIAPATTNGKIKEILPLMAEIARDMESILETSNRTNVDVKNLIKKYTIDVTATCLFGFQCETLKNRNQEFKSIINRTLDLSFIKRRIAAFAWTLFPLLVDIFQLPFFDIESINNMKDIYCETERDRELKKIKKNDLMNMMIELSKQESNHPFLKFDDVRRTAQALQFLSTGTEATAYSGAICLYELSFHSKIQRKLRNEIRENLDPDGNFSYDALNGMKYLDMVIKESLRKHSFLPFLTRYAEEDYIFEATGLKVEKGTQIIIPTAAIHNDPKYFPEPEKFDPERYSGDKKRDLQYLFLPFGEGPRKCVGDRLSLMALKLGVATILKKFELHPGEKTEIPLKFAQNSMFRSTTDGSLWLKIQKVDLNE